MNIVIAHCPLPIACCLLPIAYCRSIEGHVFERANLSSTLAATPGRCPLTGLPLTLDVCQRDSALRVRPATWVRQAQPRKR